MIKIVDNLNYYNFVKKDHIIIHLSLFFSKRILHNNENKSTFFLKIIKFQITFIFIFVKKKVLFS